MPIRELSIQERINNREESEAKIVGTKTWSKNRYSVHSKKITRQDIHFDNESQKFHTTDYNKEALENGWVFDDLTKLWSHEKYEEQKFTSLIQKTKEGKKYIPYCSDIDVHGLAYNFEVTNSGLTMSIFPNKWLSEEFDTRRGKRRILFDEKSELKKKFSNMYENDEYSNEFNYAS
jgi:hypothetical protein